MRTIEELVAGWREEVGAGGGLDRAMVRELESHLREVVDAELADGAEPEQAFENAVGQLGTVSELEVEFAKVYPELSWAQRLLLIVVGYGAVALAMSLFYWARLIGSALTAAVFPQAMLALPKPIEVEHDREDIVRAGLPEEGVTISHIHGATLAGNIAMLLAMLGFCAAVIWSFKRKPSWLRRLIGNRRSLAILALSLCGALLLVSHQFFMGLFERGMGSGSGSYKDVIERAGIGQHEFSLVQWWFWRKMAWLKVLLLGVLAFAVLRLLRRQEPKGSSLFWLFGGYFTVVACSSLFGFVGLAFGMVSGAAADTLLPGVLQGGFQMPTWLVWTAPYGSMHPLLTLGAQLVLLLVLSIRIYLDLGRRRFSIGEPPRGFVARHCYWALGLWFLLFAWPSASVFDVLIFLPAGVLDALGLTLGKAMVVPVVARGAVIALLLLAVTLVGSLGRRSGSPEVP